MFSGSTSPITKLTPTNRLIQSFTTDKTMFELLKDELRQSIMREEEQKYQLQLFSQQNQDLQTQAEVLHQKIQSLNNEVSKQEEVAHIHKEKCEMMQKFIKSHKSETKESEELNQLKQEVKHLTSELQKQKNSQNQYEEIYSKIKSLQTQCQELKDQNKDLKSQNDRSLHEKENLKRQLQQKEQDIVISKQKLSKLEALYSQKAESVDVFFTEAESKINQEKRINSELQEELHYTLQERQRMIQTIQDLKELLDCKQQEICESKQELQKATQECEDLRRNDQRFQDEFENLYEEKEKLAKQFDNLQGQMEDFEHCNRQLKQQLEEEAHVHEEQMVKLEEICYEYKKACDQAKHNYNQCQDRYDLLLDQHQDLKVVSNQNIERLNQIIRQQEENIDILQGKIKEISAMYNQLLDTKESDRNNSYYIGKQSARTRYITDNSEQNSSRQAKELKCRLNARHSANPTMQPQSSKSRISVGDVEEKHEHSPMIWDPSQQIKKPSIDNISPIASDKVFVSGTIKRRDIPKSANRGSERNFNSLFNSNSDKENLPMTSNSNNSTMGTKTFDQLKEKYENLRHRINQK